MTSALGPPSRTATGAQAASNEWPEGIEERCPWPRRTAVLLAEEPHEIAVDALRAVGFSSVVVRPSATPAELALIDPFTFVLVGPEALVQPEATQVLGTLRELSPVARIVLLARDDIDGPLLVRAIRGGVQEVADPLDHIALVSILRAQLGRAGRRRERVLAVGAHPDDIEIGCAGALLEHRRRRSRRAPPRRARACRTSRAGRLCLASYRRSGPGNAGRRRRSPRSPPRRRRSRRSGTYPRPNRRTAGFRSPRQPTRRNRGQPQLRLRSGQPPDSGGTEARAL